MVLAGGPVKLSPKAIVTAVAAVIVGTLVARGLPHHAAAPAPAPSSGGPGGITLYDVLIVLIAGALIWWAIHLRHKRNMREIHMAEAKLDRFVRVSRADLNDLWRCSDCHCLIMLADIDDHQEVSACAQYQRWLEDNDAAETELEPPAYVAEQVSQSATMPPEHSVIGGDLDTFNSARGEIE
jgi:hypothetical protein